MCVHIITTEWYRHGPRRSTGFTARGCSIPRGRSHPPRWEKPTAPVGRCPVRTRWDTCPSRKWWTGRSGDTVRLHRAPIVRISKRQHHGDSRHDQLPSGSWTRIAHEAPGRTCRRGGRAQKRGRGEGIWHPYARCRPCRRRYKSAVGRKGDPDRAQSGKNGNAWDEQAPRGSRTGSSSALYGWNFPTGVGEAFKVTAGDSAQHVGCASWASSNP